jgi:hypothetical protein
MESWEQETKTLMIIYIIYIFNIEYMKIKIIIKIIEFYSLIKSTINKLRFSLTKTKFCFSSVLFNLLYFNCIIKSKYQRRL